MMRTAAILVLASFLALALAGPRETHSAALPGANGLIAFHSDRDGNNEIYVVNPGGGGETNLTNDPAQDIEPAWSPDGSKIAFASNRDGVYRVYVMDSGGQNVTPVTPPAFVTAGGPTWSPDGAHIAFHGFENPGDDYDIWVIASDGSGAPAPVTTDPAQDTQPRWSPAGDRIGFVSTRDGNPELYLAGPDGSDLTRLTDTPAEEKEISWAPDASKIAFASPREGGKFQVFVMNPDGSDPQKITDDPAGAGHPAWSPDGARMAFHSVRDGLHDIWVMKPDGTNQVRLTTDPATDFGPDWQPLPSITGDMNCDGLVNPVDALIILRHVAGLSFNVPGCPPPGSPGPNLIRKGDLNCDGQINPVDALRVLRYVAALPVSPIAGCPEIGA